MQRFNQLLDHLSEYLAHRKGLLPMLGLVFVVVNFILQFIPGLGGLASTNLFLHLGVIFAVVGMILAWVL